MRVLGKTNKGHILHVSNDEFHLMTGSNPNNVKEGENYDIAKIFHSLEQIKNNKAKFQVVAQKAQDIVDGANKAISLIGDNNG